MKKLLLLVLILAPIIFSAQSSKEIINVLLENKPGAVINVFADEVDLTIIDDEAIYSKAQASKLYSQFRSDLEGVRGFETKHEGISKLNYKFIIGDFNQEGGDLYRMTIFIKEINGVNKVSQLRIEEL